MSCNKATHKKYMYTAPRCLPKLCKRSNDEKFWFERGKDGRCGTVEEGILWTQVPAYEKYRKDAGKRFLIRKKANESKQYKKKNKSKKNKSKKGIKKCW